MNNINHGKLEKGSNVCPSCKSENWKSAKLVVMEGTTNTSGPIVGVSTEPGAFSGGVRNFLLSDRWFSWDYPINAEIGLTSRTGLVEEIKRLMVEEGSKINIPTPPAKIRRKPENPLEKALEKALKESKGRKFMSDIVILFLIFVAIYNLFDLQEHVVMLAVLFWGLVFLNGARVDKEKISPNKFMRIKEAVHESELEKYEKHEEDLSQYEKELDHYKKQLAEYEAEKNKVIQARELLWECARVCTRCGTAYIGSA